MPKKDNTKILLIGVVILIIIIASIINNKSKDKTDYSNMTQEELVVSIENKVEKTTINKLAGLGERDRIEYYVSCFTTAVENKEYEKAYGMLYKEFKNRYFPTLDSFEQYAKTKFPKMFALEHTNFERNGDVYVLWVNMYNALGSKSDAIETNFVVRENDLNDFEMSFKVN